MFLTSYVLSIYNALTTFMFYVFLIFDVGQNASLLHQTRMNRSKMRYTQKKIKRLQNVVRWE